MPDLITETLPVPSVMVTPKLPEQSEELKKLTYSFPVREAFRGFPSHRLTVNEKILNGFERMDLASALGSFNLRQIGYLLSTESFPSIDAGEVATGTEEDYLQKVRKVIDGKSGELEDSKFRRVLVRIALDEIDKITEGVNKGWGNISQPVDLELETNRRMQFISRLTSLKPQG